MVQPVSEHVAAAHPADVFEVHVNHGESLGPLPFEYIEGLVVAGCLRASDLVVRGGAAEMRLGSWPRLDRAFEAQERRASVGMSLAAFDTAAALLSALGLEPAQVRRVEAPPPVPEPDATLDALAAEAEAMLAPSAPSPDVAAADDDDGTNAQWVDYDPFADDAFDPLAAGAPEPDPLPATEALASSPPAPPEPPTPAIEAEPRAPVAATPAKPPLQVPLPGQSVSGVRAQAREASAATAVAGVAAVLGLIVLLALGHGVLFTAPAALSEGASWPLAGACLAVAAVAVVLMLRPEIQLDAREVAAPPGWGIGVALLGGALLGAAAPAFTSMPSLFASVIARVGLAVALEALIRGALDTAFSQIPNRTLRIGVAGLTFAVVYTAALAPWLQAPLMAFGLATWVGVGLAAIRQCSGSANLAAVTHVVFAVAAMFIVD